MEKIKEYQSGDVTVVWKPSSCIHSEKCWRGLPEVFKPKDKPWIQADKAGQERLIDQIKKCPSGALSYKLKGESVLTESNKLVIAVSKDGPYLIKQEVSIELPNGSRELRSKATALCRCGASANKPYCDGSHKEINFQA